MSSYLNVNARANREVDGTWDASGPRTLVEFKHTNNARDARDMLVSLAYALQNEPRDTKGLCVIVSDRLSPKRVADLLNEFSAILHPDLINRLELAVLKPDGTLQGSSRDRDQQFVAWLRNLNAAIRSEESRGRVTQEQVAAVLVQQWLRREGPQTSKAIQHITRASYPTVTAVLKDFESKGWLEYRQGRSIEIQCPSNSGWLDLLKAHAAERRNLRYVDPTGLSRTPQAYAERLAKIQKEGKAKDACISGILGAAHYYPAIDITASPRLDIAVLSDDIAWVSKIDAGLELTSDPTAKAVLVLHVTRIPKEFVLNEDGYAWAPEIECLADLVELGYTREAIDMVTALSKTRLAQGEHK